MRTGVRSWELAWTSELQRRSMSVRSRAASAEVPGHVELRRLIAAGVPRLVTLANDEELPDSRFCERCIGLRGDPLSEAPLRLLARERARAWEFLSGGPRVPTTTAGLLGFYEVANRLEPHHCTTIAARLRTADDPLPFSHGRYFFDRVPVLPECETCPAGEIPAAVEELLRFVARDDLPAECLAFASYFLLLRIHPFRDGNGHAARLLVLALLASHYRRDILLVLVALMQVRRDELVSYLEGIRMGRSGIGDLVGYGLTLLDEACDPCAMGLRQGRTLR